MSDIEVPVDERARGGWALYATKVLTLHIGGGLGLWPAVGKSRVVVERISGSA